MKKKQFDPGTGGKNPSNAKRIINKDGSFNVKHINREKQFRDIYHALINMDWKWFVPLIFTGYVVSNLFFAGLYYFLGVEYLGLSPTHCILDFLNCFYFSAQTFTTVGYGAIAPHGIIASLLASFEAFVGLLAFSFATSLLYGRFSTAKPNLRFSDHLLLRPYQDGHALMFRVMHKNPNIIMNVEVEVSLSLKYKNENGYDLKYFPIQLERDKVTYLPFTWTVVCILDEKNPLYKMNYDEICAQTGELLITINYFDDTFSQNVFQRNSYTFEELKKNTEFSPAYHYNSDGYVLMNHEKLNDTLDIK